MTGAVEPGRLSAAVRPADHACGPLDAGVTLVEYGDFECPHCVRAFAIVERVRTSFPADVRFVYRHYPLTDIHPRAMDAARAAEAAGLQGAFWPMHARLYSRPGRLARDDLRAHAEALGLDAARFRRDFSAPAVDRRILGDAHGGDRSGVERTPTFFVNGRRHEGPADPATLGKAILAAREGP